MRGYAVLLVSLLSACEGLLVLETAEVEQDSAPPVVRVDAGEAAGDAGDAAICDVGDPRPLAVYFGTREPTLLSLSEGQKLAVVMYRPGGYCSGTVIADRWVLSAKHCNPSGSEYGSVHLGPDPDDPTTVIEVANVVRHPERDLLLLELSESVTSRLPDLEFIPYFTGEIDSTWIGRAVECAGYGRQEDDTIGQRRFTAQPVSGVSETQVTVDGEGERGLCGGDSGGPVMFQDSGARVYVLGALTGGDSSCVGEDHYARVDPSWVLEHVGPSAEPCDGLDARGECRDNMARWCEGGALQTRECGAGTTCRDGEEGYRCRAPDSGIPCDGLTLQGRCTEGGTAEWCEGGSVRRAFCARCGLVCRPMTELGGVWCDEP